SPRHDGQESQGAKQEQAGMHGRHGDTEARGELAESHGEVRTGQTNLPNLGLHGFAPSLAQCAGEGWGGVPLLLPCCVSTRCLERRPKSYPSPALPFTCGEREGAKAAF